ncbi:glycerol-3-phosphate 1-O-acyltransferase PlsY [Oceanicaulis sp.]|uniref:glycerol-3-phosphate 1-O-acyltransferase PlsY n=1 Tax=Oceanicaulis sp. TaxID=1924941 RepID=UPI003BABF39A
MFDPWFAAALVVGYVFGSIPFGLLLTRLAGLGDIRAVGSGNIGATNVLRTGRKDLALATLILDSGKAGFACLLFTALASPTAGLIAGGAAFFGHCFPVWLKFQGGKGVATFLGVLLAAFWPVGVLTCLVWLGMALLMRMSSLAALTSALAAPLLAYAFGQEPVAMLALFLAVLLYWRHKDNISRILSGDEPKIGAKKA